MGVGTWREVHGWPPPCPVPPLNDPFSRLRGLSCAVEGLHLNGKAAKVLVGKIEEALGCMVAAGTVGYPMTLGGWAYRPTSKMTASCMY